MVLTHVRSIEAFAFLVPLVLAKPLGEQSTAAAARRAGRRGLARPLRDPTGASRSWRRPGPRPSTLMSSITVHLDEGRDAGRRVDLPRSVGASAPSR